MAFAEVFFFYQNLKQSGSGCFFIFFTIFQEGYSDELAKKANNNEVGIGMWRGKQMMKLNGGRI